MIMHEIKCVELFSYAIGWMKLLLYIYPFYSIKWVELKMGQLGELSNPNCKTTALLDQLAMITVQSDTCGIFDCKPLGLIWAQFLQVQASDNSFNYLHLCPFLYYLKVIGTFINLYQKKKMKRMKRVSMESCLHVCTHQEITLEKYLTLLTMPWKLELRCPSCSACCRDLKNVFCLMLLWNLSQLIKGHNIRCSNCFLLSMSHTK